MKSQEKFCMKGAIMQTGRGKAWNDAHFAASHEEAESLDDLMDANPGRTPMALYGRTRVLHLPKNPRINWGRCWNSPPDMYQGTHIAERRQDHDERNESRIAPYRMASVDIDALMGLQTWREQQKESIENII